MLCLGPVGDRALSFAHLFIVWAYLDGSDSLVKDGNSGLSFCHRVGCLRSGRGFWLTVHSSPTLIK